MKKTTKRTSNDSWLAVGIAIGVAFGVLFNQIGLGICIGLIAGAVIDHSKRNKNKSDDN